MKLNLSAAAAVLLSVQIFGAPLSRTEQRFQAVRKSPPELYAFLFEMPKGGDLHNHVAGAVYAETVLRAAAADSFCINMSALSIVTPTGSGCPADGVPATRAESDNKLAGALVDSLSMRDFVPGAESNHDHFFAAFDKFTATSSRHTGDFVAEVINRAAQQNESYLELMAIAGKSVSALGMQAGFTGNFDESAAKLREGGLPEAVSALRKQLDMIDAQRRKALDCDTKPDSPACKVVVRYVYQVLRESRQPQVFAQVLAGFMLAADDPRVAAVNFVQPEDGLVSMRDYRVQMQMVNYAKRLYPKVHITLHAGELAPGLVPPEDLRFHIREAVEIGQAERIGHGVSVMYENDAVGLLELMKKKHVAVEINLTSNDLILGVKGNDHPFPVYRKYGVPVVLCTDDEGVSRSHLTQEYLRAVLTYGLTYADVKQLVRNSIEYSFLSGASYWSGSSYRMPVQACAAGMQSKACQSFLAGSGKAQVQANLESRFEQFEKRNAALH